jgi:hypothetical protein
MCQIVQGSQTVYHKRRKNLAFEYWRLGTAGNEITIETSNPQWRDKEPVAFSGLIG